MFRPPFLPSLPSLFLPGGFHLDLVGPLPSRHGFTYLLSMNDWMTCWSEVASLSSITAETCVRFFLSIWVARFGVPSVLMFHRGAQFTASICTGVCCSLGISPSTTTSFHPESNGMIELFHRSLKTALHATWLALIGSFTFLWSS